MSAEELASALRGRRYSRGWRARCPSHDDRHPSLDIGERNGRVVFICRAGCSQRQVVSALRASGIWPDSPEPRATRVPRWDDSPIVSITACCLDPVPCSHWRRFEKEALIASLVGNLHDAVGELRDKAERGYYYHGLPRDPAEPLHPGELMDGIKYAISFGAIVPTAVPNDVVEFVLSDVLASEVSRGS